MIIIWVAASRLTQVNTVFAVRLDLSRIITVADQQDIWLIKRLVRYMKKFAKTDLDEHEDNDQYLDYFYDIWDMPIPDVRYVVMKGNDRYEDDAGREALVFVIKEIGEYDIYSDPRSRSYSRRLDLSAQDFHGFFGFFSGFTFD